MNITCWPALNDDEGTYLSQAWSVATHGALAPYTYWYDHPPAGWIQLASLSWLPGWVAPGSPAVAAGRVIMVFATLADVVLLYHLARRLGLHRPFATAAVLMTTLSPLFVFYGRQIYLDDLALPWVLAAFLLALSRRQHLWHYASAGGCFGVAVLTKETVAVLLPALLFLLWQQMHRSTRAFSLTAFAAALLVVLCTYPLYAAIKNELLPGSGHVSLIDGVRFQLWGRQSSGWVLDPSSGAHGVAMGWLGFDRLLIVGGGIAAVAVLLLIPRLRAVGLAVILLVLTVLRPGYLPGMFIIAAIPFLALCLAGLSDTAWARARKLTPGRPRVAALAALAAAFLGIAVTVLPGWAAKDHAAMTVNVNTETASASRWLQHNLNRHARVVVDNTLWLDLARAGFRTPFGAIWFYKLDLDPAAHKMLPHGWRDIDYIVGTRTIREDPNQLTQVRAALTHSKVLMRFGSGETAIEIRKVVPS